MKDDMHDFKEFMKRREDASNAFVNGNFDPLNAISSHASPATIFGPKGDTVEGADKVNAANASGSKMFETGGENSFEIMQIGSSDDLAYWVGVQRSKVKMKGKPEAIPMDLRVTEIFRREGDEWKLIHRHADALLSN